LFRVSLRELFVVFAFVAVATASMRYASPLWRTSVFAIAMAIFMWAAVVAVVDRGHRQARAIGMALVMVIYGVFVLGIRSGSTSREFDPRSGQLPTTMLVSYFYNPVTTEVWRDLYGQELANYDPAKPPQGVRALRGATVSPEPRTFMQIAHCWWGLLLGYVAGRFAQIVYLRRIDPPRPSPTND
jgi:hypothetical protein